jgi:hypothetical protein
MTYRHGWHQSGKGDLEMKMLTTGLLALVFTSAAFAQVATYQTERVVGMHKYCLYDAAGDEHVIVKKAHESCSRHIEV